MSHYLTTIHLIFSHSISELGSVHMPEKHPTRRVYSHSSSHLLFEEFHFLVQTGIKLFIFPLYGPSAGIIGMSQHGQDSLIVSYMDSAFCSKFKHFETGFITSLTLHTHSDILNKKTFSNLSTHSVTVTVNSLGFLVVYK